MRTRIFALALALLVLPRAWAEEANVAPAQPPLEVALKGSDSMDPLIRLWIEEFQKTRKEVAFKVVSRGSATAPPALASGEVRLGHMSREMTPEEQAAFHAKRGFAVTRLVVARAELVGSP